MNISSRTPEGDLNCCPVCGKEIRLTPSRPPGDAPCPNCGHLLWFVETPAGRMYYTRIALVRFDNSPPRIEAPSIDLRSIPTDDSATQESDALIHPNTRVQIVDGYFRHFEGVVESIDQLNGRLTVGINIFGRVTPVELELRQVKSV